MGRMRNIIEKFKKSLKLSVVDPQNFEEKWSITSTAGRIISLLILSLFLFSILILFLFSTLFNSTTGRGDVSIERSKLEDQSAMLDGLKQRVENQEKYISTLKLILLGEVPINSNIDSLYQVKQSKSDQLSDVATENEKEIAKKVKDDMRTTKSEKKLSLDYFSNPVNGILSQNYDAENHVGVDVVTKQDEVFKACLSGTVLYVGYTRKDGNVILINHPNGYVSVYKHAKTIFKKIGAKVRIGDGLGIVGNTGENSTGPHLHFEIWHNQIPLDPTKLVDFKN
jgi:murein DD-endopeptidase MepM/ murein hydrolase activator NlpD